jgi:chromodomain-helicase-DNA-binding protein 1
VNNYWPRQSVTVPAIRAMYQRMLQSEMSAKQPSTAEPTDEQKNGA